MVYKNTAQSIETVQTINEQEKKNAVMKDDVADFKNFVDKHVSSKTKFPSAEELITNSKPWRFVWYIAGIFLCSMFSFWGKDALGVLVLEIGSATCVAVFVVSTIIRKKYIRKFSG